MFTKDVKQKQVNNIAMITFWSQFAVYTLNTVMVLFLTRAVWQHGLGYSEAKAYAFIGVAQAMGYLMPMLGGHMADNVVGIRRSVLLGSILIAIAYLLVMISGFTVPFWGDKLFIAAYALIPATNSLLLGTSSSLVSRIYSDDEARAKSGMTLYYMSINIGALLATIISPQLIDSRYGPLSIFAIVFIGKSLSALNFAWRYRFYDNVIAYKDKVTMGSAQIRKLTAYIAAIYLLTLGAYYNPNIASYIIGSGCTLGILWFLSKSLKLEGESKTKQLLAIMLILEAIVFFVIYNQMSTTLILFAKNNSNLNLFGLTVAPANYQMINPIVIIVMGFLLPKFYQKYQGFNIPYQFAAGTALAGVALLVMYYACLQAPSASVDGNYIALTYFLISIAELWVSAIGLSMIGLYCDGKMIAFAMGAWYLGQSLSNIISGQVAKLVALPKSDGASIANLHAYQSYYLDLGLFALMAGGLMWVLALQLKPRMSARNIVLH